MIYFECIKACPKIIAPNYTTSIFSRDFISLFFHITGAIYRIVTNNSSEKAMYCLRCLSLLSVRTAHSPTHSQWCPLVYNIAVGLPPLISLRTVSQLFHDSQYRQTQFDMLQSGNCFAFELSCSCVCHSFVL